MSPLDLLANEYDFQSELLYGYLYKFVFPPKLVDTEHLPTKPAERVVEEVIHTLITLPTGRLTFKLDISVLAYEFVYSEEPHNDENVAIFLSV